MLYILLASLEAPPFCHAWWLRGHPQTILPDYNHPHPHLLGYLNQIHSVMPLSPKRYLEWADGEPAVDENGRYPPGRTPRHPHHPRRGEFHQGSIVDVISAVPKTE